MKRWIGVSIALAGVAAGLYFAAFSGTGTRASTGEPSPADPQLNGAEEGPATLAKAPNPNEPGARAPLGASARIATTVALWISDAEIPAAGARTVPAGSGRTALLTGAVTREGVALANAAVRCVAGLNEGAKAVTDAEGHYALPGLYPGLAIVEFEAQGQPRARREVLLRRNAEETLDLDCGGWGNVRGTICGIDGKPLEGAAVELDGIVGTTAKDGAFFFSGVIPGNCILYISAAGHELRREVVPLRPSQALEFESNRFLLRAAEPLTVSFELVPAGGRPLMVAILPGDSPRPRNFPFEKVGLRSLAPGEATIKIDGIPVGDAFQVRAFSDAGIGTPAVRPVLLKKGDTNLSRASFTFAWKTPYSGKVVSEGRPVAAARVRVESADVARAMEDLLRDTGGLAAAALPILPPARREVGVGTDGAFRVEGGDVFLPASLVIDAPGFERRALPLKGVPHDYGEIALVPRAKGAAGPVTISFDRPAERDVRVFVNGRPLPKKSLQRDERLEIPGIEPGIYGIRVQEASEDDSFAPFERAAVLLPASSPIRVPLR